MNYAPELIGVGVYTTGLATFLTARGHGVEVVAAMPHYPSWSIAADHSGPYSRRCEQGVRITRCWLLARPGKAWRLVAPLSFAFTSAPVVWWRILADRPRTVLCVEPTLLAAPMTLLAAYLVGARTVLHVQDLELDAACVTGYLARVTPLVWAARRFECFVRSRFDAVVTISDAMAGRLRRQVAPDALRVLRNWIDADGSTAPWSRNDARRALGVPAESRLVLYAGNLGAKQGLGVLIEAARILRADPSIHLLVVGEGVMAGPIRAAAAGLPNLSHRGLLPAGQFSSLLAAADLHVLPQDKAASDLVFPSKLGPLLKSGKPILVTAEPQSELATWLGSAALRCPPGDGRALAAAIAKAVRLHDAPDPERAATLIAALDAGTVLPGFEACLMPPECVRADRRPPAADGRPMSCPAV